MHLAMNEYIQRFEYIKKENKIKLNSASHCEGKMEKGYWMTEHVHIPHTAKYKIQ